MSSTVYYSRCQCRTLVWTVSSLSLHAKYTDTQIQAFQIGRHKMLHPGRQKKHGIKTEHEVRNKGVNVELNCPGFRGGGGLGQLSPTLTMGDEKKAPHSRYFLWLTATLLIRLGVGFIFAVIEPLHRHFTLSFPRIPLRLLGRFISAVP